MVGRKQQCVDLTDRHGVDKRTPAGQLAKFPGKGTRAVIHDWQVMSMSIAAGDPHPPGQDDQHSGIGLAGFVNPVTVSVPLRLGESPQPVDFIWGQRRKRLGASSVQIGGVRSDETRLAHCRSTMI